MEMDLALLAAAEAGEGPFLRLYAWDGPWVSLGYFQKPKSAVDVARAQASGIGVVSRPTGGKALLHDRDLTYSVVLPPGHPLAALSRVDSYLALSGRLVAALSEVGVPATLGPSPENADTTERRRDVPCATEVHVDTVLVRGRKLIGSAQVRRRGAILQHGSIPLAESPPEVVRALLPPGQEGTQAWLDWYHDRTTTLEREARPGVREALEAALLHAFADL